MDFIKAVSAGLVALAYLAASVDDAVDEETKSWRLLLLDFFIAALFAVPVRGFDIFSIRSVSFTRHMFLSADCGGTQFVSYSAAGTVVAAHMANAVVDRRFQPTTLVLTSAIISSLAAHAVAIERCVAAVPHGKFRVTRERRA